jgi:glycerate dehydrogenase
MQRIVFLERNTFTIDFRRPNFDHEWIEYGETRREEILPRLRHASIVIVNKLLLREPYLSRLPQLKLIAVAATGVDNIDLPFCRRRGIAVCNTRGYAIHSLPEHVLMLILALKRNLIAYIGEVDQGVWQKANQFCLLDYPIGDLYGSTLGIIGYGSLGQAVGNLATSLGMRVLVAERHNATVVREGRTHFRQVLELSDVVTLHCPLNEETRGLIDSDELDLMKSSAILINTARGGLVGEPALVQALRDKKIAGAGFDVLTLEPPREGNLLLEADLPNLIVTPHIAWASQNAMRTLADQLVKNLEAFVRGEPKNLV